MKEREKERERDRQTDRQIDNYNYNDYNTTTLHDATAATTNANILRYITLH